MTDRLKMPPNRDAKFYQRRKHDSWREVPAPEPPLETSVADSHAHIHMLPDPAWELARCALNGVDYLCMIVDPSEDGTRPFDELDNWLSNAQSELEHMGDVTSPSAPVVRIATGVHPHNAKLYTDEIERALIERFHDSRVVALGEIGLDYHYDLSPRNTQRDVFRRQIELSHELELPIVLHLRGGDDPQIDNAHAEAFEILREMDALGPSTLLHCCTLPPDEILPWIEADCFIAFGGAVTFKSADAAREGVRLVPSNRLLFETDAPYMTPEPMRGAACTPAHVIFTAAAIADMRGCVDETERRQLLDQVRANTLSFYTR